MVVDVGGGDLMRIVSSTGGGRYRRNPEPGGTLRS